jgi:hypothetical protein
VYGSSLKVFSPTQYSNFVQCFFIAFTKIVFSPKLTHPENVLWKEIPNLRIIYFKTGMYVDTNDLHRSAAKGGNIEGPEEFVAKHHQ